MSVTGTIKNSQCRRNLQKSERKWREKYNLQNGSERSRDGACELWLQEHGEEKARLLACYRCSAYVVFNKPRNHEIEVSNSRVYLHGAWVGSYKGRRVLQKRK